MPQHNDMFELTVSDMELIETGLRSTLAALSHAQLGETEDGRTDREDTVRRIQELLGRLHDQKVFYRPKNAVYVGG
ncbi:hypothetical protein [Roseovarius sp. EL26]|uniref:hypothetical protein n=1 Tax=Roseovarius sp. EL26 TaxID=2126672 RepID=UPI000EA1068B|nr:hypothetical protein [Roseovarius sp. EL26]